ncbi:MAG: hypothetical protein RLZZ65_268 [Bacteroidota bacterium]|jgi:hypothetical protein
MQSLNFKKNIFSILMLVSSFLVGGRVEGQTATYTVASVSSVTTSGITPSGSSATFSQTYTTAGQMTSGKSTTLTLSGYSGKVISSIVLNMKSNNSAGAGNLSVVAGSNTILSITGGPNFNTSSWYGAWSASFVNITKTPTAYTVGSGENVVITISATVNSLYINSYSITYAAPVTSPTITGAATTAPFTSTFGTASTAQTFSVSGSNLTASVNATAPTGFEVSSDGTTYGSTAAFTQSSGSASGTLYIRLSASAPVGTYNSQNIVLSSTGATNVNITTPSSGNAVTCSSGTWIGGATGNFNTASNWCGGVPASGSSLSIPVNTTVTMDGSNEIVLNNLTVDGTLILPTNAEVTVNGNITNNGQIILENKATIVQGASSTYAGSGTVQVKQAITGGNNGSSANGRFWYLGSPVAGGLSSILDAAGNNVVKYWDEPSAAWVEITDNTTALMVGKGHYLRSYTQGNQDLVFTGGLLNNGAYTFNVTANGSSFNGFNLVSNPYASYLKWDDVTKTNVGSTVWYRTSNGPNTMVFDTYNSNGNVGTSNNGNAAVSQYIPPMQAFWVKVEGSASGSIAMDNLDRSHHLSGNQGMYSMDTKLMFANLSLQNDTLKDQVIVYNSYEAADAMDAFDSEKMLQAGMPQIYSKIGDKKAVINAKLFMQRNEDTPLYMNIPTAGNFELKLGDFNSTFGSIWLEDKQTGVFQNLLLNDTYPFETQAGQDMARFVLHFGYPTQIFGSTEVSNGQVDNFENPIHWADVNINSIGNKQIELSASLTEEELNINKAIQIIDLTGRVVYEGKFSNGNSIYTVPNSNAIYLVKLNLGNQQKVYKLLVQD